MSLADYSPAYRPRWSNCVFWALRQLYCDGGYILFRHGRNGVPFHALWSPDHVNVWSYEPRVPTWRWWHWRGDFPLLYRGDVVEGDDP